MAKQNYRYYVVWQGRKTGIFHSWDDCKEQVLGFEGAIYKGFRNIDEAEDALRAGTPDFSKKSQPKQATAQLHPDAPTHRAIAVDAACSGNPGAMEYRGVWIGSGEELFHSKVYPEGTNNIGEFLAIVHALALCVQQGWSYDIYSDSRNALLWIKNGKCKTKLEPNARTAELFDVIRRAEKWLATHKYPNRLIKWDTEEWGEVPADFGRK